MCNINVDNLLTSKCITFIFFFISVLIWYLKYMYLFQAVEEMMRATPVYTDTEQRWVDTVKYVSLEPHGKGIHNTYFKQQKSANVSSHEHL